MGEAAASRSQLSRRAPQAKSRAELDAFGAIPLAFESGTGSELRNPLGITIIGGLLLSQLLTLYTTPVIYLQMEWLRARFFGETQREMQTELALPETPEPSQRPAG